MPVYLDKPEIEYLLQILKWQRPWWIRDKIISKVEYDKEEKHQMSECNHSYSLWKGKKECCAKCDAIYEPNMGISWEKISHRTAEVESSMAV